MCPWRRSLAWLQQHLVHGSRVIYFTCLNSIIQTLQPTSIPTATRWLLKLGFNSSSKKKGLFIDRHERQDVINFCKLYLRKFEVLQSTHAPPPAVNSEPEAKVSSSMKRLVLLYHDKSIFHSNNDQGWVWAEEYGVRKLSQMSRGGVDDQQPLMIFSIPKEYLTVC